VNLDLDQVGKWLAEHPEVHDVARREVLDGNPPFEHEKTCLAAWDVTCAIDGEPHELVVVITNQFPADMPKVYLRNPERYELLNHVNCHGDICFWDRRAGGFFATSRPRDILSSGIYAALKRLEESLKEPDPDNLVDEFEGFWRWLKGKQTVAFFAPPARESVRMTVRSTHKGSTITYAGELPSTAYARRFKNGDPETAWYFPLDTPVLPPSSDTVSAAYVRSLFGSVKVKTSKFDVWMKNGKFRKKPSGKKSKFRKKSEKDRPRTSQTQHYTFFFSTPRPAGGHALFGVHIKGRSKENFFESDSEKPWEITPIEIEHHYREFMTERAGAEYDLTEVSVAVVGCGAIGCRVAEKLTLMGVGELVLVDSDYFTHENVFRHYLGSSSIGTKKAKALADNLASEHVGLSTVWRHMDREEWLEDHEGEAKRMDFIVDATGDFNGMREVSRQREGMGLPPILFTWVEAAGVGGFAVLDGDTKGCFNCLVRDRDQGPYMTCHYLKPDQVVAKDLTGCGSFIPFSALDAEKTAIMACEMLLDTINDPEGSPSMYRSWRGRADVAEKMGLEFNPSFEADSPLSVKDSRDFASVICPVCRGR